MTDNAKAKPTIRRRKVRDYARDAHNPNAGSARGQRMINDSYRKHGAGRSWLADKKRRLVEGNHSQQAAIEAGIDEVWEVVIPRGVQLVGVREDLDLDDPQTGARDLSIAANRSAQESISFEVEELLRAGEEDGVNLGEYWHDDELDDLLAEDERATAADQALDDYEAGAGKRRNLGRDKQQQVRIVVYVEHLPVVERRGSDLHPVYLEVCEELLKQKAGIAGYRLIDFRGYYCGDHKAMTHYLAILEQG